MTETHRRTVTITSPHGLHLRPIQAFVALANTFPGEVFVAKAEQRVNGKSPLQLMSLVAECGTALTLEVVGPEAERAIEPLAEALCRVFPEDN